MRRSIRPRLQVWKVAGKLITDPYLHGFYERLFYRDSCGTCPFAQPDRIGDITLGDAWGIGKVDPKINPILGASLVIAHSDKGMKYVERIGQRMNLKPIDYSWAVDANEQLRKPTVFHSEREVLLFAAPVRFFWGNTKNTGLSDDCNRQAKIEFVKEKNIEGRIIARMVINSDMFMCIPSA